MADRCGGNVSFAMVKDSNGKELSRFEYPTQQESQRIEESVQDQPHVMPYFVVTDDPYRRLKEEVILSVLKQEEAKDVFPLRVAMEAMKLAEYATEELNKCLKAK